MNTLLGKDVRVFMISPRTRDRQQYWTDILNTISWSDKYGCTGVLIFTGNDTYVEPWLVAQVAVEKTSRLCPLVAVNPIYMHPFTVAKMITSFYFLYQRKLYLNMVTGTAINYLEALGDNLSHDARYERLREYGQLIKSLTTGKPVTFKGEFYNVFDLQLLPGIPAEFAPEFLLAGQSPGARRVSESLNAIGMQMLKPNLADAEIAHRGVHFGIVTRPSEDEAWTAARRLFPEDLIAQEMLELSMENTDSVWKQRMKIAADQAGSSSPGYWLEPFKNFQADCPYFVGSYDQTAKLLSAFTARGIDTFIFDIVAIEEEYEHLDNACRLLREVATPQSAVFAR